MSSDRAREQWLHLSNFGACTSGVIIRNFNECTTLGTIFTGNVKLSWSGQVLCLLFEINEFIKRDPDFIITGRLGATIKVKKISLDDQKLTWISGEGEDKVFRFESDGINRSYKALDNSIMFDQTTSVVSPITVTGTNRFNRKMSGGILRVRNNLTGDSCDYTPTDVLWTPNCNCPTSGSWTGTCSNSNKSNLMITGCGTATFTDGSFRENVILDRCGT